MLSPAGLRRLVVLMEVVEPCSAFWDDGDWIVWDELGGSHPERPELGALWPKADVSLVPVFQELLDVAASYHMQTGRHLLVYGDIGELFGAIACGIRLHRNYAMGSDGRLGNDFVEIKTIAPFSQNVRVTVRMDRHFSKLLVVRIDEDFAVSARLVDRKRLRGGGKLATLSWDMAGDLAEATFSTPAG